MATSKNGMSASKLSLNVKTCHENFQNVGVTFRGYITPKAQVFEQNFMFKSGLI